MDQVPLACKDRQFLDAVQFSSLCLLYVFLNFALSFTPGTNAISFLYGRTKNQASANDLPKYTNICGKIIDRKLRFVSEI